MKKALSTHHVLSLALVTLMPLLLVACLNDGDSAVPSSEESSSNSNSENNEVLGSACSIEDDGTTVFCIEDTSITSAYCDSIETIYQSYGLETYTTTTRTSCPSGQISTCSEEGTSYYTYDSDWEICETISSSSSPSTNSSSSTSNREDGACAINVNEVTVLCIESDSITAAVCDSAEIEYASSGMDSVTTTSLSSCPTDQLSTCTENGFTYSSYDSEWDICSLLDE